MKEEGEKQGISKTAARVASQNHSAEGIHAPPHTTDTASTTTTRPNTDAVIVVPPHCPGPIWLPVLASTIKMNSLWYLLHCLSCSQLKVQSKCIQMTDQFSHALSSKGNQERQ